MRELRIQEHDRLGPEQPVLGAAERDDVRPGRDLGERHPERRRRVRETRPVDVQHEIVLVGEIRELPHLRDRVQRPELGALRDRHRARLHRVLVADPRDPALDRLRGQLAVGARRQQQLEPGDRLRRPALVDVQVRGVGADHGLEAPARGAQRHHVRAGPVEHEERARVLAERPRHPRLDRERVVVVPVPERVPGVHARDRREDVGVDRGRVVRGEAPSGVVHAASLALSDE